MPQTNTSNKKLSFPTIASSDEEEVRLSKAAYASCKLDAGSIMRQKGKMRKKVTMVVTAWSLPASKLVRLLNSSLNIFFRRIDRSTKATLEIIANLFFFMQLKKGVQERGEEKCVCVCVCVYVCVCVNMCA